MDDFEIWKDIPGEHGYQVSSIGRVRSTSRLLITRRGVRKRITGRILALRIEKGYFCVTIRRKKCMVHKLVAEAFIGRPSDLSLEVCHNDGDSLNNIKENLRYDTHSNNILDAVRHGTWGPTSKTKCPQGHKYTDDNTKREVVNGYNRRTCLECQRKRSRDWFRKNRSTDQSKWKKPHL